MTREKPELGRREKILHRQLEEIKRRVKKTHQFGEATRYMWSLFKASTEGGHEIRVRWLQAGGWDPGGWAVMEWHRLPKRLTEDLEKVLVRFLVEDDNSVFRR